MPQGKHKGLISGFCRLISGLHWPQAVPLSSPKIALNCQRGLDWSKVWSALYRGLNFICCGKTASKWANIW